MPGLAGIDPEDHRRRIKAEVERTVNGAGLDGCNDQPCQRRTSAGSGPVSANNRSKGSGFELRGNLDNCSR